MNDYPEQFAIAVRGPLTRERVKTFLETLPAAKWFAVHFDDHFGGGVQFHIRAKHSLQTAFMGFDLSGCEFAEYQVRLEPWAFAQSASTVAASDDREEQ